MDFDRWLQRFVTAMEKIIFRTALALVVLLFIVQALMINESFRQYMSITDKIEGDPVKENIREAMAKASSGEIRTQEEVTLVLELVDPPQSPFTLYLLVNNKVAAQLGEKDITINVRSGDMLEVVGEVQGGVPVTIRIKEIYGNIKAPRKGDEIKTFGERDLLAWIIPE